MRYPTLAYQTDQTVEPDPRPTAQRRDEEGGPTAALLTLPLDKPNSISAADDPRRSCAEQTASETFTAAQAMLSADTGGL
jgi:hypothetical protein